MAFTPFSEDMDIISKLADNPNSDNGMTPTQLKAEFDKAGKKIKTYINDTLLLEAVEKPAAEGLMKFSYGTVSAAEAGKDYQAPLGDKSVSKSMLGDDVTAAALGGATLDSHGRVNSVQASAFRVDISASSTLTLDHAGRFVLVNASDAVTITVPADSDVAWPDYTEIEFCQWGSGAVTIEGASGVGIVSMDNAKTIAGQYGCCCLKKTGGNTWILAGALA